MVDVINLVLMLFSYGRRRENMDNGGYPGISIVVSVVLLHITAHGTHIR